MRQAARQHGRHAGAQPLEPGPDAADRARRRPAALAGRRLQAPRLLPHRGRAPARRPTCRTWIEEIRTLEPDVPATPLGGRDPQRAGRSARHAAGRDRARDRRHQHRGPVAGRRRRLRPAPRRAAVRRRAGRRSAGPRAEAQRPAGRRRGLRQRRGQLRVQAHAARACRGRRCQVVLRQEESRTCWPDRGDRRRPTARPQAVRLPLPARRRWAGSAT